LNSLMRGAANRPMAASPAASVPSVAIRQAWRRGDGPAATQAESASSGSRAGTSAKGCRTNIISSAATAPKPAPSRS
jgi:hypothetical protein